MPVSNIDFEPLIDWCQAPSPTPELAPRVGAFFKKSNSAPESPVEIKFEGTLSYIPSLEKIPSRYFPAQFGGTLRDISSNNLVNVFVSLRGDQPIFDLVNVSFSGGPQTGAFFEVDAIANVGGPQVPVLLFTEENSFYCLILWQTYSCIEAP